MWQAKIKAILFDCDGTLVDSESFHYRSWQAALQKFGGDLTEKQYFSYVGNCAKLNARLMTQALENQCHPQDLLDEKISVFYHLANKGLPSIDSTVNFLRSLLIEKKRFGLKVGVASAVNKKELLSHLEHLNVAKDLDLILSGQDELSAYQDPEGVNKPKPYIYIEAARRLGLSPSECVVIEDSKPGVQAAFSAGCFTVAVPNLYTIGQDLSLAHLKIQSFEGISLQEFLNRLN